MAASEIEPPPLVALRAVSDVRNAWVALSLELGAGEEASVLPRLFAAPDFLAAIAPLDALLRLHDPQSLSAAMLASMPANRVGFCFPAAALADAGAKAALALHDAGYRVLIDGAAPEGVAIPPALRARARDCANDVPQGFPLVSSFGPHLAYHVDSVPRLHDCAAAGFTWFSGLHPLRPPPVREPDDGSSRKRLLALLALLARDAETRELEFVLKQDPALSYHLLKLVNSAAFALATPISSFAQAISLLGRRQLQRWLQLLLYARQQDDGLPNLLLPIAAQRAAQMESLCKAGGGDREAQDQAFMTGVFSLLDVLFATPMAELVGELGLVSAVSEALLAREGRLGSLLALVEQERPAESALEAADVSRAQWWQSQLHAFHWAIQVSRNL